MKILHSTFSLSRKGGGVSEVLRELTASLSVIDDIDVKVIGPIDTDTTEQDNVWNCQTESYRVTGPSAFGYSPDTSRIYNEYAPDIAHVHGVWMHYSMANQRYCRKQSVPYLISPHGMLDRWALKNSQWKKRLARVLFENRHLKHAACLHALCEQEAQEFRRLGLTNPICVIPNGVASMQPTEKLPNWDGTFEAGRPVMLFLGRLHPKKGLLQLLDVWHKIRDARSKDNWALAIAGWDQSGYMQQLQDKIHHHGMQADVKLIGPVFGENKSAALQSANAFILPSFSEGLPVAVLEAWAAALPVIMTPECNLPEGFPHAAVKIGTNATLMMDGLRKFFELNAWDRQQMGQAGSALVQEKFVWSTISRQFEAVYAWMLGKSDRPEFVVDKDR